MNVQKCKWYRIEQIIKCAQSVRIQEQNLFFILIVSERERKNTNYNKNAFEIRQTARDIKLF